jgi:hypothetical protein
MVRLLIGSALIALAGFAAYPCSAAEKDVFDHAAQKATPKSVKKIVFVADTGTHGPRGNHEFMAGAILMARTINAAYPDTAYAVVHSKDHWPKDLSHADAVIVLLNHGGSAVNPAVRAAMDRGAGFMGVHFGVEVNKGDQGDAFLKWMGGCFEQFWSVNPFWTPEFKSLPDHPVTRGVYRRGEDALVVFGSTATAAVWAAKTTSRSSPVTRCGVSRRAAKSGQTSITRGRR